MTATAVPMAQIHESYRRHHGNLLVSKTESDRRLIMRKTVMHCTVNMRAEKNFIVRLFIVMM